VEGYKAYRVWNYLVTHYFEGDTIIATDMSSVVLIIATIVMDEIVLVMIVVSTIICVNNFGKGLKEILIKQNKAKGQKEELNDSNVSSSHI
jgi:hypothetical protein